MPKPFNEELHKDIIALKKVAVVMGPNADFRHMFRSIMRVHNISRTTVYNELAKDYPGTYQPPGKQKNDPPFSSVEITAVKDLLFNRIPANTIVKTMSSLLGFPLNSLYCPGNSVIYKIFSSIKIKFRMKKKYFFKTRQLAGLSAQLKLIIIKIIV